MGRRPRDIIVLGGSAGGLSAVSLVLSVLPSGFPASIFIVLHRERSPLRPEGVTQIFASRTVLPTHCARDAQQIEAGHVYVAPADHHIVLENGLICLYSSPIENRFRPCIDVLFKSAASIYGRRVIGVLLSGAFGNDGAAGLWQIRHRGGLTIVQDPNDAKFPGMPQGAIDNVAVDYVVPVAQIGPTLIELTRRERDDHVSAARILVVEDESVVATNLQQSLIAMGYDAIDWVPTGEAAIELAACEHPDLILMDIHLAGALSGIESARRIWQTEQIPIVYCTAHADLDTLKAVQTTESYGYVVKPVQSGAVRVAIELALARREKELR